MGVISMTIAGTAGVNPVISGGAVISGCFFGDRCSPLSSSTILVASVTETNLFDNIRNMLRTAAVPFALTCIIYGAIGLCGINQVDAASISDVFAKEFQLNRWMILPAVIVLGLSMLRVDVKKSMTLSIVCAVILCVVFQHRSAAEIIRIMLTGYRAGDPVFQNTIASGVIPQISAILGPCAGGACYSPALTDFIFMVDGKSHMFVTGPDVVKAVTHEEVGKEELGGAYTHSSKSGVAHFIGPSEEDVLMSIRELFGFLPSNNMEDAPVVPTSDDIHREDERLDTLIPADPNVPYDVKELIESVVDDHYFFEVMPHFAKNVVIGFARLGGRPVGIVANNPAFLAGVLDIDASDKAARFIRFCDCFNIPLITLEDVPGFLPGCTQEHGGIIRHGAKIVYAYVEATIPKITLILRKAYGGAYIVMSRKQTGSDVNLAYPTAEIAVMGAEGAVNILFRHADEQQRAQAVEEYREHFANPYRAAELGYVDEIILPRQTRFKLIQALDMAHNKIRSNPPKKHGNMPL